MPANSEGAARVVDPAQAAPREVAPPDSPPSQRPRPPLRAASGNGSSGALPASGGSSGAMNVTTPLLVSSGEQLDEPVSLQPPVKAERTANMAGLMYGETPKKDMDSTVMVIPYAAAGGKAASSQDDDEWAEEEDASLEGRVEAMTKRLAKMERRVAEVQGSDATQQEQLKRLLSDAQQVDSLVQKHIRAQQPNFERRVVERVEESLSVKARDGTLQIASTKQAQDGTLQLASTKQDATTPTKMTEQNLEAALEQKLSADAPNRLDYGCPEHVVRDIVTGVVRESVSIFECLLDRLLKEKKQGMIRSMVAELLVEDISGTMATGYEQLKQKEFENLYQEMDALRQEVTKSETRWEDRFEVTGELQKDHDALKAKVDTVVQESSARLQKLEAEVMPRASLESQLQVLQQESKVATERSEKAMQVEGEIRKWMKEHESFCTSTFVTAETAAKANMELESQVKLVQAEALEALKALERVAAKEARVADLQASTEQAQEALKEALGDTKRDVIVLREDLKRHELFSERRYATKEEEQAAFEELSTRMQNSNMELRKALSDLQDTSATKQALAELRGQTQESLKKLEEMQASTSATLQQTASGLQALDDRCITELATKDQCCEIAEEVARQATTYQDNKEDLAKIQKEMEDDRARARKRDEQMFESRKYLNSVVEDVYELRTQSDQLSAKAGRMNEQISQLDAREVAHRDEGLGAVREHKKALEDLQEFFKSIREEMRSHQEMSMSENQKVKEYSTMRYLEQIDKGLFLQKSMQGLETGHKELKAEVTAIKLPPVA